MKKSIDRLPNREAVALELQEKTVRIGGGIRMVVRFVFAAKVPQLTVFVTKIETRYEVLRRWLLHRRPAAGQEGGDNEGD